MSDSTIPDCFRALLDRTARRLSDYEKAAFEYLIDQVERRDQGLDVTPISIVPLDMAFTQDRAGLECLLRDGRAPRPPEELVDALQDRAHPTSGRLLAAKPIAKPKSQSKSPWRKTMFPIAKKVT